MPATTASASAKLILLGEHAVVYGHPAIAIPFSDMRLRVSIEPAILAKTGTLRVISPDMDMDLLFDEMSPDEPIRQMISLLLDFLGIKTLPTCTMRIRSDIPLGAGFGSSAALSVGIMRALSAFLGHPLDEKDLVSLACQSDQFIHGRLSGIDTTVIALEQAIYYQRGKDIEAIKPLNSLHFVVADSGVYTPTARSVAYLAERYEKDNQATKDKLLAIEEQVITAKQAMRVGDLQMLGNAMNANQTLLYDLGLSCPELDALVDVARDTGALGAKLSGGGQGGAMLALADESRVPQLRDTLQAAGAKAVWTTTLPASQIFPL